MRTRGHCEECGQLENLTFHEDQWACAACIKEYEEQKDNAREQD